MRAEESESPEVDVIGKANGVADPAGLLNPKLKPVAGAEVVAGAPVKNNTFLVLISDVCSCCPSNYMFFETPSSQDTRTL